MVEKYLKLLSENKNNVRNLKKREKELKKKKKV